MHVFLCKILSFSCLFYKKNQSICYNDCTVRDEMSDQRDFYKGYADAKRDQNEGSEKFPWGTLVFVIGVIVAIIAVVVL